MSARRLTVAVILAVVALAACGDSDDGSDGAGTDPTTGTVAPVTTREPGEASTPPTTEAAPATTFERSETQPTLDGPNVDPTTTGVPVGATPTADLSAAVADLAGRLDVDPSIVLVVSEQNVTWRNSSIGCPEPGMAYLDRLVDGVRIVLDVDGRQYSYHAGGSRPIFYCETPQLPGD